MTTPLDMAEERAEASNNLESGIGNGIENNNNSSLPFPSVDTQTRRKSEVDDEAMKFHAGETVEPTTRLLPYTTDQSEVIQQRDEHPLQRTRAKKSSNKSRQMGHYPPRPESRQESHSPPTAFLEPPSQLSESLHELSNQFEESVGKPSREALHKFFYPSTNASPSPSRRHGKAQIPPRVREKMIDQVQNDKGVPGSLVLPLSVQPQPTEAQPPFEDEDDTCNPKPTIHRTRISVDSADNSLECPSEEEWPHAPISPGFHQSFDAEEEQDRKYVEGFWRTYDDVIMMSLFTQLGVLARLAASTWISYFDGGVFRSDSPLFTNLPLNCFSCFILGLLGSGDRLMEMVTTRFTPRHLQQGLLQEDHLYRDEDDDDGDGDQEEEDPKGGTRRRKRQSKRATKKPFHSWEPPLHWHDDLREVQLLALERRIRASKCLLLFPVMKEDTDVMEHYFGEGYQASAAKEKQKIRGFQKAGSANGRSKRTRHRRKFGRQRYAATNQADVEQCGQDSGNWDDFYSQEEEESTSHNEESENQEYEDDGRFRFDLELTECHSSTSMPPIPTANTNEKKTETTGGSTITTSVPPSVQKLIKRAPGRSTDRTKRLSSSTFKPPPQVSPKAPPATQQAAEAPVLMGPLSALAAAAAGVPPGSVGFVQSASNSTQQQALQAPINGEQVTGGQSRAYSSDRSQDTVSEGDVDDPQLEQIISNVQANVSENINRIRRVNLADGWDVGTTPEDMSDDLMLGLRDGFCGALSSFSSWNSSMLDLLREGQIGAAVVGYMIGIQLPIVAYRFGQQVSVYIFVWRCRREARRDEMKGWYGIQVKMDDDDDCENGNPGREGNGSDGRASTDEHFEEEPTGVRSMESSVGEQSAPQEVPSVRAICTAVFLLSVVTQCTSLSFFSDPRDQQIALSLLFSPFGTLARWRLSQLNGWRPGFPLGTFSCNILACALSGSLGSLLAGKPGPRERILLQSIIAGFGVSLSSLATFVVEILAGMDPLLFRFDGLIYAFCSIGWALIVGFVFEASADWADATT